MSAEHDRKFFDTFMLILGILAAITIGLMVLAGMISDRTAKRFHDEDPRKVAGNPGAHRAGRPRRRRRPGQLGAGPARRSPDGSSGRLAG